MTLVGVWGKEKLICSRTLFEMGIVVLRGESGVVVGGKG